MAKSITAKLLILCGSEPSHYVAFVLRQSMPQLPDLDSPEKIDSFIDCFYAKVLTDELLAPIFIDVAQIDLPKHKAFICSYWEKLVLKTPGYNRHTMNIHRDLADKTPLRAHHFARWLALFHETLEQHYQGPKADYVHHTARHIADNMERAVA